MRRAFPSLLTTAVIIAAGGAIVPSRAAYNNGVADSSDWPTAIGVNGLAVAAEREAITSPETLALQGLSWTRSQSEPGQVVYAGQRGRRQEPSSGAASRPSPVGVTFL
jgi:hypothetical protein